MFTTVYTELILASCEFQICITFTRKEIIRRDILCIVNMSQSLLAVIFVLQFQKRTKVGFLAHNLSTVAANLKVYRHISSMNVAVVHLSTQHAVSICIDRQVDCD
jgi:hypothetical protein